MPEESTVCRKYAEGVTAIEDGICLIMETVGGEEDVHAMPSGAIIYRAQVNDLVCHEGEG